jgi:hypothetical protein
LNKTIIITAASDDAFAEVLNRKILPDMNILSQSAAKSREAYALRQLLTVPPPAHPKQP